MLWDALIISLKTATTSILLTSLLSLITAKLVTSIHTPTLKNTIDSILTLPLVLPPTVIGFLLLILVGNNRPIGKLFIEILDYRIAFSWSATVLAAVVVSFPLMYRATRGALEQVDPDIVSAARTLGLSENTIFWKISLPTALPGIAAGAVLAFARGMGEFGATAMIAGNIAGRTRTLPLAVYSAVAAGDMAAARNCVLVIIAVSFLTVGLLNHFLDREKRGAVTRKGRR